MRRFLFHRAVRAVAAGLVAASVVWPVRGAAQEDGGAAYYFLLGRHLESRGLTEDAEKAHRQAIALAPDSAELRAELAGFYARQDRVVDAIEAAEQAIARDSDNREAHRILGTIYAAYVDQRRSIRPGDDPATYAARAIASLERARKTGLLDVSLELTLGRLYVHTRDFASAIPVLARVVEDQPAFPDAALLLAAAQDGAGDAGAAMATLERTLEVNPSFYRGWVPLAEMYERAGRWRDAAHAFGRAQSLNPRAGELTGRRAAALINSGQAAEARDLLTETLARRGPAQDPGLLYMLAQAHRQLRDFPQAEATARQLHAKYPDDVRGVFVLGQILSSRGDHDAAIELLGPEIDKLRATAPAQAGLLLTTYGSSLHQVGRREDAIAAFEEALAQGPGDPMRHALLAQGYSSAGRHEDALRVMDEARKLFPDDLTLLYQHASVAERSERYAEAERLFRELLAREPKHANALNYLGYMLAERGERLDEAVALIQQALELEPGNPSFLDSLGWAYFQQGRLDLADEPLTAAAAKMPRNSVIQDHLGDLRFRQGRYAEAVEAWERALSGDGEAIEREEIEQKLREARDLLSR